jgi:hypothetical protein
MASFTSKKYRLELEFTGPILGTQPTREVAAEFIASKHAEINGTLPADEAETLPESLERGTTVFHRAADGTPLMVSYQMKGFLKNAAGIFNGSNGVKNMKKKVNDTVSVSPKFIPLVTPPGTAMEYCDRPLRAETMQGPRTTLARSEMLPEGTTCEMEIEVFDGDISESILRGLLDYGRVCGMFQWRNSGVYGTFEYRLTRI